MLHVTLLASRTLMWGPGSVENLWTPNLRCCLLVCEVKKLKKILIRTWERLHILMPCSTRPETPCCSHLLPAMANISSFTKYEIVDNVKQLLPLQLPWGCEKKSCGWCTWNSFPLMPPVPPRKCRLAKALITSKGYHDQQYSSKIGEECMEEHWRGKCNRLWEMWRKSISGFLIVSVWWQEIWQTIMVKMCKQLVTILQLHNL